MRDRPGHPLPTAAATQALGAALARVARAGDVLALVGPLGAGKTTLARAFVQARAGAAIEVPSPTFTLVQIYEVDGPAIWHVDAYRLQDPAEAVELGLEDALETAIVLIEWPDRLADLISDRALGVVLSAAEDGAGRSVRLIPPPTGDWPDRLAQVWERVV